MTLTVSNSLATFTFETGVASGIRLTSFGPTGGTAWTNDSVELFNLIVFDTTTGLSTSLTTIHPAAAQMLSASVVGSTLTVAYGDVPAGAGDLLDVVLTATLAAGTDWLDVSITVAWDGVTTTYALDSVCVFPLLVQPKNNPNDYAAIPNIDGILAGNPIVYLRYDPTGGKTAADFGLPGNQHNTWAYPSGRGCKHPLWTYYELTTKAAWTAWLERGEPEIASVLYESNGTKMQFEATVPQENHMAVGNSASTLGTAYHVCLRPFYGRTDCIWAEAGIHYRGRLEALAPSWRPPLRKSNPAKSTAEQAHFIHLTVDHSFYTGSSAYLPAHAALVRESLGGSSVTPCFGTGFMGSNLQNPYEAEFPANGDRAALTALYALGIYLGLYQAGGFDPTWWSKYKWRGNEVRWWTNKLNYQALRLSRSGSLIGGADARDERISSSYYRERNYAFSAWNAGTKTLTVVGTPSGDGFGTQALTCTIIPPLATSRLASAQVASLAGSDIVVTGLFTDGVGNTVTPDATYTVEVHRSVFSFEPLAECWHALMGSTSYMTAQKNNVLGGRFDIWRGSVAYLDTFSDPLHAFQLTNYRQFCYATHIDWANIDGGYVQHPKGGGSWYGTAKKAFIAALLADVQARQTALSGNHAFLMACEDLDQTMMDVFDYCWHCCATLYLWRDMRGENPANNNYVGIPLSSVVNAGRTFRRAPLNCMTSALAITVHPSGGPSPKTDAQLHASFGYYIASEWCYGLLMPEYLIWSDDTNGTSINLYDQSIYVAAGGTVSNTVKQLRDMHRTMVVAETTGFILTWLRYGTMLPLLTLNSGRTSYTTGLSYGSDSFYFDSPVVYPKATYPRVVHAPWRSESGASVGLIVHNWTGTAGNLSTTVPLGYWGFTGFDTVSCKRYSASGTLLETKTYQGGQDVTYEVLGLAAFTWEVHVFQVEYSQVDSGPKMALRRWPLRH